MSFLKRIFTPLVLLQFLIACGGGGGSSESSFVREASKSNKTIIIELTLVRGLHGASEDQAIEIFQLAENLIEQDLEIDLILNSFSSLDNLLPDVQAQGELHSLWEAYFADQGSIKPGQIKVALLPPYHTSQNEWLFGGMASGLCTLRSNNSFVTSTAGPLSSNSEDRIFKSAVTLAHEIGHILGAEHNKEYGIMSSGFENGDISKGISFTNESISQINNCLN